MDIVDFPLPSAIQRADAASVLREVHRRSVLQGGGRSRSRGGLVPRQSRALRPRRRRSRRAARLDRRHSRLSPRPRAASAGCRRATAGQRRGPRLGGGAGGAGGFRRVPHRPSWNRRRGRRHEPLRRGIFPGVIANLAGSRQPSAAIRSFSTAASATSRLACSPTPMGRDRPTSSWPSAWAGLPPRPGAMSGALEGRRRA